MVNSLQKGKTQSREEQKEKGTKNGLMHLQQLQNNGMKVNGIFLLSYRTESQHLLHSCVLKGSNSIVLSYVKPENF